MARLPGTSNPLALAARACLALAGLAVSGASALAATPWEVAVVFLGGQEPPELQRDIDQNVLELARVAPGRLLRLSLHRELPGRSVQYFADPGSSEAHPWEALFSEPPARGIRVPGQLRVQSRDPGPGILASPSGLAGFLEGAFRIPGSRRMLVLYGHGEGPRGLRTIGLKQLRRRLEQALPRREGPRLDLLWLNSCFMATVEVAYELRKLTSLFLASQDAEFSAGAPFESLQLLESGPDSPLAVARKLAELYVDSYSYLKEGSQRRAVFSSSGTISVVQSAKLESLVGKLASLSSAIGTLSAEQRRALLRSSARRRMEQPEIADLGSLLVALWRSGLTSDEVRSALKPALQQLELSRPARLRTNPRIPVRAPAKGSLLVYGYENWTKGDETDADTLERLPESLRPGRFVPGPRGRAWPSRPAKRLLYLAPFTAGLSVFNLFFADPQGLKPLSEPQRYRRIQDTAAFEAQSEPNPILFSGYTQGIGAHAERYTGLGVLDPSQSAADPDYAETDFAARTGWGML